jgi:hypothetical protein
MLYEVVGFSANMHMREPAWKSFGCTYIHMHTSIHLYIYKYLNTSSTCIHTCMYTWTLPCMYVCLCMYVCMCVCVCLYACMCMCVFLLLSWHFNGEVIQKVALWVDKCMHACMYVCMYVCMHVCMHGCYISTQHVCIHAIRILRTFMYSHISNICIHTLHIYIRICMHVYLHASSDILLPPQPCSRRGIRGQIEVTYIHAHIHTWTHTYILYT